jgi:DNA-binding transcriptional MocR family regulator
LTTELSVVVTVESRAFGVRSADRVDGARGAVAHHVASEPPAHTATVSARSLAVTLGLDKNTVARALRRLRNRGIVGPAQRRTNGGTFDVGSYWIALPAGITVLDTAPRARRSDTRAHATLRVRAAVAGNRVLT